MACQIGCETVLWTLTTSIPSTQTIIGFCEQRAVREKYLCLSSKPMFSKYKMVGQALTKAGICFSADLLFQRAMTAPRGGCAEFPGCLCITKANLGSVRHGSRLHFESPDSSFPSHHAPEAPPQEARAPPNVATLVAVAAVFIKLRRLTRDA